MAVRRGNRKRIRLQCERLEARRLLATYFVDTQSDATGGICVADNPGGNINCSIRTAIENAALNPGDDIIQVPEGVYQLAISSLVINDADNLTVQRATGDTQPVVIRGTGSDRVFAIQQANQTALVTLDSLTIENGADFLDQSGGGGILNGAALAINNSIIRNNFAGDISISSSGGGIRTTGPLTITNSQILGNGASGFGGGIDFDPIESGIALVIEDTVIDNNNAAIDGGGIYGVHADFDVDPTISLLRTTVSNNAAEDSGGGAFVQNSTLTVTDSTFDGNQATGTRNNSDGVAGGLYFRSDGGFHSFSISGSTFNGNEAATGGGGASLEDADGTITDTIFTLNIASTLADPATPFEDGGGGFVVTALNRQPTVTATNITVDQNTAGAGGGIALIGTSLTIIDSIVTANTATNLLAGGGGIGGTSVGTLFASTLNIQQSTIGSNTATAEGGGIGLIDVDLTLTGVAIENNDAQGGRAGGVGILGSSITPTIAISQSSFTGNTAQSDGAGIYIGSVASNNSLTAETNIANTTFQQNISSGRGGGIFAPGPLGLTDVQIVGNESSEGGGLYFGTGLGSIASLTVTRTDVTDNVSQGSGGGISIETPNLNGLSASFTDSSIDRNTASEQGGGIVSTLMPLVFLRGSVSHNSTDLGVESDGGGMSVSGDLTITGTEFSSNSAGDFGGAIFYSGGVLVANGALFADNSAGENGGGFYLQADTTINASFNTVQFLRNSTLVDGGAIDASFGPNPITVDIFRSTVADNTASQNGGAFSLVNASLNVESSTLSGNTASFEGNLNSQGGGGIFAQQSTITIDNSTLSGNKLLGTSGDGGAIIASNSNVSIRHTTVTLNEAAVSGGVVASAPSNVTVGNTIIAGNTGTADVAGGFTSQGGNLIGIIGSATGFVAASDQVGDQIEPIDPLLGPLALQTPADLTATHGLLLGSPAIDSATSGPASIPTDQRGTIRPLDGDGNSIAISDIGAVEAEAVVLLTVGNLVWADTNDNGIFDQTEFGIDGVEVSMFSDANSNGIFELALDPFITTINTSGGGLFLIQQVPQGDYFLQIAQDQFAPGSPLNGFRSSIGNDPAPDPDLIPTDNDDNGAFVEGVGVTTSAFTLLAGTEPTDDGDGNANTNLSIDFGFVPVSSDAIARNDSVSTAEDVLLIISPQTLFINDTPATSGGQPFDLVISSVDPIPGVTQGNFTLNGDQTISYTGPANFFGQDQFTYTLERSSVPATITVSVTPVNDPPIANNDSFTVSVNSVNFPLPVLANDIPGPANELDQSIAIFEIATPPTLGSLQLSPSGDSLTYTPNGVTGNDFFTYFIQDDLGLTSNFATVQINLVPNNGVSGHMYCDVDGEITEDAGEQLVDQLVFIDLNGNRMFDGNEPSTLTDSQGNYFIALPGGVDPAVDVVTMVPTGCITISPFPAVQTTMGVGNLARSLVAADFDRDGDVDVLVANELSQSSASQGGDLGLLVNDHEESLELDDPILIGGRPQSVAVWESTDRGVPPVIAVSDPGSALEGGNILVGPLGNLTRIAVPGGPLEVLLADLNDDNLPEVLFSDFRSSSLRMIVGGTTIVVDLLRDVSTQVLSVAAGDYNGDSLLDLAVLSGAYTTGDAGRVQLLLGDGTGEFIESESIPLPRGVVEIKSADLDPTSAKDEILVLTRNGVLVSISFDNDVLAITSRANVDAGASSFVVGQFNGDVQLDVVIVSSVNRTSGNGNGTIVEGKLEFLVGSTTGAFIPFTQTFTVDTPSDIVSADIDGDGIDELAISNLFQVTTGPGGENQFSFPSTVTIFKLNVAVQSVVVPVGGNGVVDFAFASANPERLLDINGDMTVTPMDALIVMNALNRMGEGENSDYRVRYDVDVNRDGSTTPMDALIIINRLNQRSLRSGEGESSRYQSQPVNSIVDGDTEAERRRRSFAADKVDQIMTAGFDMF